MANYLIKYILHYEDGSTVKHLELFDHLPTRKDIEVIVIFLTEVSSMEEIEYHLYDESIGKEIEIS